jgi:hypothetical protein
MMQCITVVINFIYLKIFTQAMQKISTGLGGAPTIRRRGRRRRCGWRGVEFKAGLFLPEKFEKSFLMQIEKVE